MKSIMSLILGIVIGIIVSVAMLFSSVAFLFNRFGEDQPIAQKIEARVETSIKQANLALDGAEGKYIKSVDHSTCKCNGTKVITHGDGHKTPCLCNPCKCSATPPAVPYAEFPIELEGTLDAVQTELADYKRENQELKKQVESLNKQSTSVSDLLRKLANAEDNLRTEKEQKEKLLLESNKLKEKSLQLEAKTANSDQELGNLRNSFELVKKEKVLGDRKIQLIEAGITGEELNVTLKKFENVSDEIFKNILTTIKKESPQGVNQQ